MQPHRAKIAAPHGEVGGGVKLAADGGAGADEQVFSGGEAVRGGGDGESVECVAAHGEGLQSLDRRAGVCQYII